MAEINLPFRNPPAWGRLIYTPTTTIPDPIMATVANQGGPKTNIAQSFNGMFSQRQGPVETFKPLPKPVEKPAEDLPADKSTAKVNPQNLATIYEKLGGLDERIYSIESSEINLQKYLKAQRALLNEMKKTLEIQQDVLDLARETLKEQAEQLKEQDEVLENVMHWITMVQVHGRAPVPGHLMHRRPQQDAQQTSKVGAAGAPSFGKHFRHGCGKLHGWSYDCAW